MTSQPADPVEKAHDCGTHLLHAFANIPMDKRTLRVQEIKLVVWGKVGQCQTRRQVQI